MARAVGGQEAGGYGLEDESVEKMLYGLLRALMPVATASASAKTSTARPRAKSMFEMSRVSQLLFRDFVAQLRNGE